MKTHQLQDARSTLSRLVEDALRGEPQRITRRGRDAVVLVSEAQWLKHAPDPPAGAHSLRNILLDNPLEPDEWRDLLGQIRATRREMGADFVDEDVR